MAASQGNEQSETEANGYYVGPNFASCYYEVSVDTHISFQIQALDAFRELFSHPPFLKYQQALSAGEERIQVVSTNFGANPSAVILRNGACDKEGFDQVFSVALAGFRPFMAKGMGSASVNEMRELAAPQLEYNRIDSSSEKLSELEAKFAIRQKTYKIGSCVVRVDTSSSFRGMFGHGARSRTWMALSNRIELLVWNAIRDYRFPILEVSSTGKGQMYLLLYDHCDASSVAISALPELIERSEPNLRSTEWIVEPVCLDHRAFERVFH
jgi:hypothetical protein